MKRTIITVTLAALVLAGLTGWVIGTMAGGSDDPATIVSTSGDVPSSTAPGNPARTPEADPLASPDASPTPS